MPSPHRLVALLCTLIVAGPAAAAAVEPTGHAIDTFAQAGREAVVVARAAAGSTLPEVYLVVRPNGGGNAASAVVYIGLGAIVDGVRFGDSSVDVTYRDHWPVDRPGAPTRQRVRAFPLIGEPSRPAWAAPADLSR